MTDTIKRWECPECGRRTWANEHWVRGGSHAKCPGVPVERPYRLEGVERQEFIDALLDDKAVEAGWGSCSTDAISDDEEIEDVRSIIRAAIAAATEED